ncbi:HDIG domain-containing metalloprotein [Bacillus toyonensis]|uniref:HDIG domain-containing metalloprotein n=1 Tax=Bacillus toyonensis TaxID=155322 RepID=UPI002E207CDA|nr:HDIG domain-containing protein [Bacillus toyonensis]
MKKLMNFRHLSVLFLFSLLILACTQPSSFFYSKVQLDSIVQNDIIAPKSATYIDKKATQDLKEETLKEIKNVYDRDLKVSDEQIKELNGFYDSLLDVKTKMDESKEVDFKGLIKSVKNPYSLSENELRRILKISKDDLTRSREYLANKLKRIYDLGSRQENLKGIKEELNNDSSLYLFNSAVREDLVPKISEKIVVNEVLNDDETTKQKKETLDKLTPVYKKITKGEVIARENDKITEEHIQKLEALDLINKKFNWSDFLLKYPNILLFTILFHLYCARFLGEQFSSMRKYVFTLLLIAGVTFLSQLLQGTFWLLVPFITSLIVFAVFWGRKFVIAASIFIGFLINGDDFIYMLLSLIIGLSLSFLYHDFRRFTDAIKTGSILGVIVSFSHIILFYSFEQRFILEDSLQLISAGIISGIIANGLIPLLENMLGMATIYKLTELNKYDHPILEELYRKAKGTYDHSRNVGHLCSSASKRIGANTLLLKVGALYHDIGKMENPEYFIENSSPNNNIHNTLNPLESADIILGHSEKGVKLCKKYNLPQEVIDVIYSHHGDTVLYHFYQKALELNLDVTIDDFRYKTPTPKTKEQGILLLADSTEAYSRSLNFSSIEDLEVQIRDFIYKKIKQGVLRDCELSTKDIEICIEEFSSAIYATHHQRVKYHTDKVEK